MITDVDVVWNPFEDIVPRTTPEERRAAKETKWVWGKGHPNLET